MGNLQKTSRRIITAILGFRDRRVFPDAFFVDPSVEFRNTDVIKDIEGDVDRLCGCGSLLGFFDLGFAALGIISHCQSTWGPRYSSAITRRRLHTMACDLLEHWAFSDYM